MRTLVIHTPLVDFDAIAEGEQPRCVLVHGSAGDLHIWDSVCEALGASLEWLRYDLRGFGRTVSRDSGPFNHADDLLRILDAQAIERCDLVGVSMGGGVALHFTLNHPERVRRLVLVSPGIAGWDWTQAWRDLLAPITASARSGAIEQAKELWWQHPLLATTRESPGARALRESIERFSGQEWIHDAHEAVMPDVERLHELQTRTLLMTGGRDLDEFRLMADLIEGSAGNLQRIDIPSAGHLLPLEEPRRCADAIAAFLAEDTAVNQTVTI